MWLYRKKATCLHGSAFRNAFLKNLVKTRHLPHLAAGVISLTNSYEPNTK